MCLSLFRLGTTATAVEGWSVADSSLIAQTMTDADGALQIGQRAEGEFYLRLVHFDYGTAETEPFELVDAEGRYLGTLRFPVHVVALDLRYEATEQGRFFAQGRVTPSRKGSDRAADRLAVLRSTCRTPWVGTVACDAGREVT